MDGCESLASADFTVEEMLPTPTVAVTTVDPATCGGNGTINFTFTDVADGTYTVNYDGGSFSVVVTGGTGSASAVAGTYNDLTITNTDGCTSVDGVSATLTDPSAPDVPVISTSNADCFADGVSTITNYDANVNYMFSDPALTVDASGVISGAATGTNYTVYAEENGCNSASASFENDPMLPTPDAPTVTVVNPTCAADGTATISNFDGDYTYTFSPTGPTVTAGTISGVAFGTSYTVTATNLDGCESLASADFTVEEMLPTPTVAVTTVDPATCGGNGTINFTFTDVADGTYTVNYDGGSFSVVVTGGTGSASAVAGTYNDLTITNTDGCTSVDGVSATLTDPSAPDVPVVDVTAPTCDDDGYAIVNNYDNTVNYIFSPTGPSVDTNGDIIGADLEVAYTVYAEQNNCHSANESFTIETQLPNPVVSAGSDIEICDGEVVTLEATGADTYVWNNGASNSDSYTVSPAFTTSYTVIGSNSYGCIDSSTVTVTVNPLPTVEVDEDLKICQGSEIVLAVNSPNNDYTYNWYLDEEFVHEGNTYTITSAEETDEGEYIIVAENQFGCQAMTVTYLTVEGCKIEITEVISPNNDGKNDVFYVVNLASYPNSQLWIYNKWGAEVYHSDNYQNDWDGTSTNALNVGGNELPEGTYYYVLILGGTDAPNSGETHKGYVYLKR